MNRAAYGVAPAPWLRWYYKELGGHTHVRVFMNGGKCGDLVFRNEEFSRLLEWAKSDPSRMLECIPEGENPEPP